MSPWLRLVPVLFVAVVLHTTVLASLRLFGVAADVLVLAGVAAGIVAGAAWGAKVGFVAGLLADLFLVRSPLGLSAMAYGLAGFAVGGLHTSLLEAPWWLSVASAAAGSAVGTVLFAGLGALVGQPTLPAGDLGTVAIVVAVLDAALSVGAVPVLRWAIVDGGTSRPVPP